MNTDGYNLVEDVLYPSDNAYDIPYLRLGSQTGKHIIKKGRPKPPHLLGNRHTNTPRRAWLSHTLSIPRREDSFMSGGLFRSHIPEYDAKVQHFFR